MANLYKNAGFAISTTDLTTIYTVPAGRTHIYMAIAENPFVTSTGVPATAR